VILQTLALFKTTWPNYPLALESAAVYQIALADLDRRDVEAAALQAITHCKYLPVPAELRSLAVDCRVQRITDAVIVAETAAWLREQGR
jgi:hypothetical protein